MPSFIKKLMSESYQNNGEVKSIYQIFKVNRNKIKNGVLIHKWILYLIISIVIFTLLALYGSVGILHTLKAKPRAAFYNENCTSRSCIDNLNLKCLKNTCQCDSGYIYINKCILKKEFMEKCHLTSYCKDNTNLICKDGVCKCDDYKYWNGKSCVSKVSYGVSCSNDIQCLTDTYLYCDSTTQLCSCDDINRYWDGSSCYPKKLFNEKCSSITGCQNIKYLICKSGICTCNSTQYWDSIQSKCVNKIQENGTCYNIQQCYSPMNCTNNTICQCGDKQYHDLTSLLCTSQKTFGQACNIDYNCRVDKYLECRNGLCQCISSYPIWSVGYDKCIIPLSYSGYCYDAADCDSTKSLYCNDGSYNCTCPLNLPLRNCDCIRSINNEYYWNGTSCVPTIGYNQTCVNSSSTYMCKTMTEGTQCIGPSQFICKCPSLQYYNYANGKCQNQISDLLPCIESDSCRNDLGLSCQYGVCQCNLTYQFWNGSKCINYFTYNNETCSNNDECYGALICLSIASDTCNCPNTVPIQKCDCPKRVAGTEYYWNGYECTPSLTYNSNCSSNYTCKTESQLTSCIGPIFKCQCPSLQFFNGIQCESQHVINGSCSDDEECRMDLGLYCNESNESCQCNSTIPLWTGSKCSDFYTYNNQTCSSDSQCQSSLICRISGSSCDCPASVSNKCDCPSRVNGSEYYWNGTRCVMAASYNQSCSSGNYTCQTLTQNTICNTVTGRCSCDSSAIWNSTYCYSLCLPNWYYWRGSCFRASSIKTNGVYLFTITSANIIKMCYNVSNSILGRLRDSDISAPIFVTANGFNDEYIDTFRVSNTNNYFSKDNLFKITFSGASKDCIRLNSGASSASFGDHDCDNNHYILCEYILI